MRSLRCTLWLSLLAFALLAAGCASTGGGGDHAMAPAATAEPPAPPPAPEPPPPPPFEATEYHNADYGFRVLYPADFQSQPPENGTLFTAVSPMQVPRLDVSRTDLTPGLTLDMAATAAENQFKTLGGGEAEVVEKKETKLSDGTEAMEFLINWTFQGFAVQSLAVFAPHAQDMILVVVSGVDGMTQLTDLSNIAHTLRFD